MNEKIAPWRWLTGSALLGGALVIGAWGLATEPVRADRDHDDRRSKTLLVQSPALDAYREACGECHMAYPPALLPAAHWRKMLAGLDDHFGENAELEPATREAVSQYLQDNAADAGGYAARRYSKRVSDSLRISEQPWFVRKHDEIPPRLVRDNPEVGSFGQCDRCHRQAPEGDFDEHRVRIPGYGRWDD